jgi:endonuclease/exonuclease/phosphatase family metal-dependent hydrolase
MITVATYNIMRGLYADLILKNIEVLMNKGVDVFCFQEADVPFEKPLNTFLQKPEHAGWRVVYGHAGHGGNIAILWNTQKMQLRDYELIPFPTLPKPAISQRLGLRREMRHRAGLACTFAYDRKSVRITSVHFAWEGGMRQRSIELSYLRDVLMRSSVDSDIIAGDFNTVPEIRRRGQEKKIEKIFGSQWKNALPDIQWTYAMTDYLDPQAGVETISRVCRWLGITFRGRLDYFFTQNVSTVSGEMLDLPGSDHRPIIGTFLMDL